MRSYCDIICMHIIYYSLSFLLSTCITFNTNAINSETLNFSSLEIYHYFLSPLLMGICVTFMFHCKTNKYLCNSICAYRLKYSFR